MLNAIKSNSGSPERCDESFFKLPNNFSYLRRDASALLYKTIISSVQKNVFFCTKRGVTHYTFYLIYSIYLL